MSTFIKKEQTRLFIVIICIDAKYLLLTPAQFSITEWKTRFNVSPIGSR